MLRAFNCQKLCQTREWVLNGTFVLEESLVTCFSFLNNMLKELPEKVKKVNIISINIILG